MLRMAKSNVFLSGLGGLGVEIGEYVQLVRMQIIHSNLLTC